MTPYDRLALLEKKLREPLPEGITFNLNTWFETGDCGTAACAVGLATTIPEFQAEGLWRSPWFDSPYMRHPRFGTLEGFEAAAAFFGIHKDEAEHIFDSDSYRSETLNPSPIDVADRIGWLLATMRLKHTPTETG